MSGISLALFWWRSIAVSTNAWATVPTIAAFARRTTFAWR